MHNDCKKWILSRFYRCRNRSSESWKVLVDEAKLRLEARCMASRDPNFAPRHTASLLSTHTHTPLSDSGSPIPGREISKESPGITCPQISLSPFQKVPRSSAKYAPVLAPKPKPLSMTPSFLAPDREGATKLGCYLAVGQWATLPKYTSMTLFSGWFPRLHPGLSPYLVEDLLQVGRAHAVSQVAVGRVGAVVVVGRGYWVKAVKR